MCPVPGWERGRETADERRVTVLDDKGIFGEYFLVSNRIDGGCAPPIPAPLAAAGVRGERF